MKWEAYPAGIFDVDSTLNRRRNFDGRRKSVEISTVVEISTLIRRRYFAGRRKSVEKIFRRRNLPAGYFLIIRRLLVGDL